LKKVSNEFKQTKRGLKSRVIQAGDMDNANGKHSPTTDELA